MLIAFWPAISMFLNGFASNFVLNSYFTLSGCTRIIVVTGTSQVPRTGHYTKLALAGIRTRPEQIEKYFIDRYLGDPFSKDILFYPLIR